MGAELLIASFLRVAREDLDGAVVLASRGNRNAVYLLQQAAEKIVRAVLTSEGQHGGVTHQLVQLVDLVPDENPVKPALRTLEELSAYATTFRYPTPAGRIARAPSAEELADLIRKVEDALAEVVVRFGVDLADKGPAFRPGPIR